VKSVDFKGPVVPTSKQENPKKTKIAATTPKKKLQIKMHKFYPHAERCPEYIQERRFWRKDPAKPKGEVDRK